jgi:ABC-type branched-subunit amino acid transport system substrate-binding protein
MRKKLALAFASLLLIVLAVPAASCSSSSSVINLGSVMDLTGSLSGMGPLINNGVQLAVNQINAAGGINGKQVVLYEEDGGTDPTISLTAVKKLASVNGCKVIIGPMTSGAVEAAAPYALSNKVLLITPSGTSPDLSGSTYTADRQFVFRTVTSDALQGEAMAQLVTQGGFKKVAILAMNNSYGSGIAGVVTTQLAGKATIVANISYDPTTLNYLTELQTIKSDAPDCIIQVSYQADADVIYTEASQLGMSNIQWIAPDGVFSTATLGTAQAAAFMAQCVEGTAAAAPAGLAAYATFSSQYQAAFGVAPGVYAENAYDAANLVFAAMKVVGTTDATKIAAEVLTLAQNYQGASGTITLNSIGDRVSGSYQVWKVVDTNGTYSFSTVTTIAL